MTWPDYVRSVIAKLDEWFWLIERGEADKRMPDPFGKRYDTDFVDKIFSTIDEFIEAELRDHPGYWASGGFNHLQGVIDLPADFKRLTNPASREAFVQDLMTVINQWKQTIDKWKQDNPIEYEALG